MPMCLYYDCTIFGSPSRSSSSALDFFVFGLIHYIAPPHFTFYMPTGIVQMKNGTKGKRRGKGKKRGGKEKKEKRKREEKVTIPKSCVFDECATFFMLEEEEPRTMALVPKL